MRLLALLAILALAFTQIGWQSETGGGIVSENTAIVETSVEATQVLQSDLLSLLYGETRLGGVVNYASFDSGGVASFRNVASSSDKILLNNNDSLVWLRTDGVPVRVSLNTADVFELPRTKVTGIISADGVKTTSLDTSLITGVTSMSVTAFSSDTLHVGTNGLDVSGDANFVKASSGTAHVSGVLNVSGNTNVVGISGDNVTTTGATITNGTISNLGSTNGTITTLNSTTGTIAEAYLTQAHIGGNQRNYLQSGKLYYQGNRPKRTIYLTGSGATPINSTQSVDTTGTGGASPIFKQTRIVLRPDSITEAMWNFVVPDSYVGTSVDASIVWYGTNTEDTRGVSFDLNTSQIADGDLWTSITYNNYASATKSSVASGVVNVTTPVSLPNLWTSGETAIVKIRRNVTDAADTSSHDVNILGVKLEYEAQSESD